MSIKVLDQSEGHNWKSYHGDCVEVVQALPDNSIHYSISSFPFSSLYTYSASDRDMGNCKDDAEFYEHFQFLIKHLYRAMMPGRCLSFHCMNLPTSKARDGYIGIKDFRGQLIRMFCGGEAEDLYFSVRHLRRRSLEAVVNGDNKRAQRMEDSACAIEEELRSFPETSNFIYHSEVCIWKDPVTAMQRTKAIGLLHKQVKKDSCISRQGIADYLVTVRKPGENPEPVSGMFEDFSGENGPSGAVPGTERFSIEVWQRYASPVWMDINPSNTLQFKSAREESDERHICPLQLQVIDRGIDLWSNPGDIVFTPFMGIGSECHEAIKMGRRAVGVELKESYYRQAVENLKRAESEMSSLSLF
jgi:hypothetical protein